MKIKRFFATDIRQAMKMVREELGSDAVIMSNRTVDGGVEIVAARDFDEQVIQSKVQKQQPIEVSAPVTEMPMRGVQARKADIYASNQADPYGKKVSDLPEFESNKRGNNAVHVIPSQRKPENPFTKNEQRLPIGGPERAAAIRKGLEEYVGYAEKMQLRGTNQTPIVKPVTNSALANPNRSAQPVISRPQAEKIASTPEIKRPTFVPPVVNAPEKVAAPVVKPAQENLSEKLLLQMSKDLKDLRSVFDSKLASINVLRSANPNSTPIRSELLQKLAAMSISKKLSIKVANRFANHTNMEFVFTQAQELLAKVLPVVEDDLLENGGIAALVGPTGVGKTTTVAKLAAKFILKHGSNQVALITTDNYRIAAHEQLNTYGRILGVPVRVASSAEELEKVIHSFSDKKLILIDTAGMSQRDMKLMEQINTLKNSTLSIKSYLVLSAATEYKAMNEVINAFQIFDPQTAILTKLDEAASIGGAISALIEHNLALSFTTNGQQVPEDLHPACTRSLIAQCVTELDVEDLTEENNEAWVAQGYA